MNCEQVRQAMSAYFDGELDGFTSSSLDEVRDHVVSCEDCAKELRSFEQLRRLVSSQPTRQLTPPPWESIAIRLGEQSRTTLLAGSDLIVGRSEDVAARAVPLTRTASRPRRLAVGGLLTLAASALLFFSLPAPQPHDDTPVSQASVATINLQPLMELFKTDSTKALETLISQHPSDHVSLANAADEMGHRLVVQTAMKRSLPGNAQLVSTKVLQFPYCKCPKGACTCGLGGCNCLACVCQRPDGSTYLLLEHCKSQSVTFGDLPVRIVTRGGRHLQHVEVQGTTAVSWEQNGERVTAIGLRDDEEIERLLALN